MEGIRYFVGTKKWMLSQGIQLPTSPLAIEKEASEKAQTLIWLCNETQVLAVLGEYYQIQVRMLFLLLQTMFTLILVIVQIIQPAVVTC